MTDQPILLTVAVLSFHKPGDTRLCLQSIRDNLKVPAKVVLLDNGSMLEESWQFLREGLCDTLIAKRDGQGGGVGQTDLFRWVDTKYTLFVQQDQVLVEPIDTAAFDWMTGKLGRGFRCVDLNGDQSGRLVWTDRAHLIETAFFNSLAPFPNGGPGPLHHLRWNENYLQEVFAKLGNPIFHIREPLFFRDIGVWSVREVGGGIVRMRTDTKQVWWDKVPERSYVFPDMTNIEWLTSIMGKWVGGTIPERYKAHSFNCWGEVKP